MQPFQPAAVTTPAQLTYSELSGAIGAELAQPLSTLQSLALEFSGSPYILPSHQQALQAAVDMACKVARQSQQIARLAALQPRQRFEQLALEEVLAESLAGQAQQLKSHAIRIEQSIAAVDVMVDPSLLTSLLEAALGWASDCAQEVNSIYDQQGVMQPDGRIKVLLENKNWPKRAVLTIKVTALDPHYSPRGQALETQP